MEIVVVRLCLDQFVHQHRGAKNLDLQRGPLGFPQTRPSSSRARLGGLSCRGSGLFGSAKSGSARLGSSQPGSARPESAPPDPVWLAARAIGLALLGLAWHNLACSSWPQSAKKKCIIGVKNIIIGPSPRTKNCICGVKSVNNFSKMHICKFRLSAWFGLSRLPSAWLGSVQSSSAPPSSAPARVSPTRLGFGSAWLSLAWPGSARLAILNFSH